MRYENGIPANRRPLAVLYTIPTILFIFVGLLAATVVAVVGLGRAIEWVGIYLPVVVLGVFVGVFVLFVREGGKVYAKFYDELYKRP
jgi:energy-coupling factor transporter transmembrane protein EcfT